MPIFDLHAHFSFKPANSRSAKRVLPDTDHWHERFKDKADWSKFIAKMDKEVVKSSQLHGEAAAAGGFGLIVNGLYPLEHGFTSKTLNKPLSVLVGFSPEVLDDLYARKISNFQLLEREYRNLLAGQRPSAGGFKVVDSYDQIVAAREADASTICIVNSIEGAHAFADNFHDRQGNYVGMHREEAKFVRHVGQRDRNSWFELYIEGMLTNIDRVKSAWEHTPLFVTFAHHYYNHLCGHSPSLTDFVSLVLGQHGGAPNEQGFDTSYFHLGIRRWGRKVLAQLLDRKNSRGEPVRRILVDAKHMSPQARMEYYEIVDQRAAHFHDPLPIVVSHTAVSGRKNMSDTLANNRSSGTDFDLRPGEAESTKYFYAGVINLFDDEIVRVVKSDGIIGLMIDERRIMGRAVPPEAGITKARFDQVGKANKALMGIWTELRQQHAWGDLSTQAYEQAIADAERGMAPLLAELKPAYLSVLLRQLFHIVRVSATAEDPARGWSHVVLGTDYDGVINPIDIYRQSSNMRTLEKDLVDFWNGCIKGPDAAIAKIYDEGRCGKPVRTLVKKLLWDNGMEFLRKYYNDEYLLHGRLVV